MAFPDSLTSSELSLNEKFQVTVETFFPLSLFALIEIGHIGRGGSVSDKNIYLLYRHRLNTSEENFESSEDTNFIFHM